MAEMNHIIRKAGVFNPQKWSYIYSFWMSESKALCFPLMVFVNFVNSLLPWQWQFTVTF